MRKARVFVTQKILERLSFPLSPYLSRYVILCKDSMNRRRYKILREAKVLKVWYFDTCILTA